MKRLATITLLITSILWAKDSLAQQDAMYSMYMFNGLVINPAYAGSKDKLASTAIYRHQWAGFDGAPRTLSLSGHMPLPRQERVGLGLSIVNDHMAITNIFSINTYYSYSIPLGKGKLAAGLSASITSFHARFDEVQTTQSFDESFNNVSSPNLWRPNFGAGLYYRTDKYFGGFSVPHMLNYSLSDNWQLEGDSYVARQYRHLFLTGGAIFPLSKEVKMRPSILLKYVNNTPIQADFNASFLFMETLWAGLSYRTGDAFIFMIEYLHDKRFRIGYSYDLTVSQLSRYSSGTHEIMFGYEIALGRERYVSPRRMNYF